MLHSVSQQIWKTQQWPQNQKRSVFIPAPNKGNAKECSNYHTITLISHAIKIMLIILAARFQQSMNLELPDVHAGLEKAKEPNCQHLLDHRKSKRIPKNIYFCFIDYTKAFVWITTNCGMFLKRWEYQTTLPASRETCMQEKKRELERTWNKRLVQNWERSTSRLYIATLLILLIKYADCII